MVILLLLKLIERCETMEESNFRESKKHSPCVVGCGTKADTILLKYPGPFPCPFLTYFLSIFDPFPVSWSRPPETLEIYSLS